MEFRHFQTYRLPRGRRSEPLLTQALPPSGVVRPEARNARARRGRTFDVPLTASYVVRASPRVRRIPVRVVGRLSQPPWPQAQAPAPPAYPPSTIARRVRFGVGRRGRLVEFPWPQAVAPSPPTYPPQVVARRVKLGAARRGRLSVPVLAQDAPVASVRRRWLPGFLRRRRGLDSAGTFPAAATVPTVVSTRQVTATVTEVRPIRATLTQVRALAASVTPVRSIAGAFTAVTVRPIFATVTPVRAITSTLTRV